MDPQIRRKLRKIFVDLYPDEPSIRRIATDAGIDPSRIIFNSNSENNWESVFKEASHLHKFDHLLSVAEEEYSDNRTLRDLCSSYHQANVTNNSRDASLGSSLNKEKMRPVQHKSGESKIRKPNKNNIIKRSTETTNSEPDVQQHLRDENTTPSYSNIGSNSQKSPSTLTTIQDKGRFTVVEPKVTITCELPIGINKGSCLIEFSDPHLRGLTISLEHRNLLQQLVIGRHTPYQWNTRKFIKTNNDGGIRFCLEPIELQLNEADAVDLCKCVDKAIDVYVTSLVDAENAMEAWNKWVWNRWTGSHSPTEYHYSYEILFLSIKTWKLMFQFAQNNSRLPDNGYDLYTTNSSIVIETGTTIHAEIAPKSQVTSDGLCSEYMPLLYIPPDYDKAWQNKIGSKGIWSAHFTKNWLLETFLSFINNPSVDDRLHREANPQHFWASSNLRSFSYHLDIIHGWVAHGNHINIPTNLFITYCQSFNQLLSKAIIKDESNGLEYVINHLSLLISSARDINRNNLVYTYENLHITLENNLKYLQQVTHMTFDRLDFMFSAHYVLLRDFKISAPQSAINSFKKALWPLYERASFESRFCHLE